MSDINACRDALSDILETPGANPALVHDAAVSLLLALNERDTFAAEVKRYRVETMPGGNPRWLVVDAQKDTELDVGNGSAGEAWAFLIVDALNFAADRHALAAAMLVLIDRVQNHMEIDAESAAAGVSVDDEAAIAQAREALAAHDARTFAADCHALADRARAIRDRGGLNWEEREALEKLEQVANFVGDSAEDNPDLYSEN